jgi:glutamate dehydrogenase (NAD(P)+)
MVTAAVGYTESPLDVAKVNFEASAGRVLANPDLRLLLSACSRDLQIDLPVRLDNGELRLFRAFRTHHNSGRGPHLGGLRFSPAVSSGLIFALAQTLTWKAALAEVLFAGSMGGVLCNPAELSAAELERITRAYVARLQPLMGPFQDVLQPDIPSSAQIAGWMSGEYAARLHRVPAVSGDGSEPAALACVVGKPEADGGIADREQAVARGLLKLVEQIAQERGKASGQLCVALHGCTVESRNWDQIRASYIPSDSRASNPGGDIQECTNSGTALAAAVRQMGCKMVQLPDAQHTEDAVLQSACDVLILAGDECAVHLGNAAKISAPVIIEVSDLSVTPTADRILAQKGTVIIPSLVANTGAVIAAHLEWDANLRQAGISREAVGREIEARTLKAYDAVRRRAMEQNQTLRAASYDIALERTAAVESLRIP